MRVKEGLKLLGIIAISALVGACSILVITLYTATSWGGILGGICGLFIMMLTAIWLSSVFLKEYIDAFWEEEERLHEMEATAK